MAFTSFQHVGLRQTEVRNLVTILSQSTEQIGFKTPLSFDWSGNDLFVMTTDLGSQLEDDMKNLVLTNHGERLGKYNYGCNLKPLLTEYTTDENFQQEAMLRINTAFTKFMPFVELEGFDHKVLYEDNQYTGIISVFIKYSISRARISNKILEVILRVIG